MFCNPYSVLDQSALRCIITVHFTVTNTKTQVVYNRWCATSVGNVHWGTFCAHLFVFGTTAPQWVRASSFTGFLDHTQRRTTVGRTHLDEWSARPRDLYLITHNTHNRQTDMPPVGFEPTLSAGERPQTYALDRADTTTAIHYYLHSFSILSDDRSNASSKTMPPHSGI